MVEKFINNSYNSKTDKALIVIKKNGTIEMNNIPINVFDLMKSNKEINVEGTWKLIYLEERLEDRYLLSSSLKFEKKDNIDDYGTSWGIYKKNNKPVILIKVGDPDSCKAIRFIKK